MLCSLLLLSLTPAPQEIGGGWETRLWMRGRVHYGRFGDAACCPGDLNGDGISDWLVSRPGMYSAYPVLYAYSGTDGKTLYSLALGSGHWHALIDMAGVGDVDGDGADDYLIGQLATPIQGRATLISGRTGIGIAQLKGETDRSYFGETVGSIQDLDGDGVRELLIGSRGADANGLSESGTLYIYSGRTRAEIDRIEGSSAGENYGRAFDTIPDLDGDGIEDLLMGVQGTSQIPGSGRVDVYSGASRTLIMTLRSPLPNDYMGTGVLSPGDVTGDGLADIVVTAPYSERRGYRWPHLFMFSGADGSLVYELADYAIYKSQLAALGDVDDDGAPDYVVSSQFGYKSDWGIVTFRSGATGQLLFQQNGHPDSRLGRALSVATAPNAEGYYDVMVTAPGRHFGPGADRFGEARVVHFQPFLRSSADEISVSAGGEAILNLNFPDGSDGWQYKLLASSTGTGPAALHGLEVPLTRDALTERTWRGNYPGASAGKHVGILDAEGRATARIRVPAGTWSGQVGRTLYVAALAGRPGKAFELSSRVIQIEFVP